MEKKMRNPKDFIDWSKVSKNQDVINLIKQREALEDKIRSIDNMALVRYEMEALKNS
jgi:hypothetical protein